jgi:hypothetical protein
VRAAQGRSSIGRAPVSKTGGCRFESCRPCWEHPRARLDRSGDRQLNRALHQILVTRRRAHPATIAYIDRRIREGKTRREANRCLKRYLARNLYRLLENGAPQNA